MKQAALNKLIDSTVKSVARSRGWKFSGGFVFGRTGNLFFSLAIMAHAKSKNLHYVLWYKWYDFDDLFWQIVRLPENASKPLSFHAAGAWTSPMTEILSGDKALSEFNAENIEPHVERIIKESEAFRDDLAVRLTNLDENLKFLRHVQVEHLKRFPGSVRSIHTQEVLNEILNNNKSEAVRICEERIADGDWGGFMFGEWTFFTAAKEWILTN